MPPSRANGDDAAKSCARLAAASPLEEHGVAVGLAAAEDDDAAGAVEAVEVGSTDASALVDGGFAGAVGESVSSPWPDIVAFAGSCGTSPPFLPLTESSHGSQDFDFSTHSLAQARPRSPRFTDRVFSTPDTHRHDPTSLTATHRPFGPPGGPSTLALAARPAYASASLAPAACAAHIRALSLGGPKREENHKKRISARTTTSQPCDASVPQDVNLRRPASQPRMRDHGSGAVRLSRSKAV